MSGFVRPSANSPSSLNTHAAQKCANHYHWNQSAEGLGMKCKYCASIQKTEVMKETCKSITKNLILLVRDKPTGCKPIPASCSLETQSCDTEAHGGQRSRQCDLIEVLLDGESVFSYDTSACATIVVMLFKHVRFLWLQRSHTCAHYLKATQHFIVTVFCPLYLFGGSLIQLHVFHQLYNYAVQDTESIKLFSLTLDFRFFTLSQVLSALFEACRL